MQKRNSVAYERWWEDTNGDFLAREFALIHAKKWAERMEGEIKAHGSMIVLDLEGLRISNDKHALRDSVLFLADCWAYGNELFRQVKKSGILHYTDLTDY
jgi:hypothetical protein